MSLILQAIRLRGSERWQKMRKTWWKDMRSKNRRRLFRTSALYSKCSLKLRWLPIHTNENSPCLAYRLCRANSTKENPSTLLKHRSKCSSQRIQGQRIYQNRAILGKGPPKKVEKRVSNQMIPFLNLAAISHLKLKWEVLTKFCPQKLQRRPLELLMRYGEP